MKKQQVSSGTYQHYKGELYEVIGVGKHSESGENYVIYKSLYESIEYPVNSIWIRPLEMFSEDVEKDGQKVARFKRV